MKTFTVQHNGVTATVERRGASSEWHAAWWLRLGEHEFPIGGPDEFADDIAEMVRERYIGNPPPVDHATIWGGYACVCCGESGVRLWRDYNTFLEHQTLRCRFCAEAHAGKQLNGDTIGWLVPAVPTADGSTFWGYTSVPLVAVNWWKALPEHRMPVFQPRVSSVVDIIGSAVQS